MQLQIKVKEIQFYITTLYSNNEPYLYKFDHMNN